MSSIKPAHTESVRERARERKETDKERDGGRQRDRPSRAVPICSTWVRFAGGGGGGGEPPAQHQQVPVPYNIYIM